MARGKKNANIKIVSAVENVTAKAPETEVKAVEYVEEPVEAGTTTVVIHMADETVEEPAKVEAPKVAEAAAEPIKEDAPVSEKPKKGRKTAAEKKAEDKPVAEKKARGGRKPTAEKKASEKSAVKEKAKKEPKAKKPVAEKKTPAKKVASAAKAANDSFVIQSNGKDYTMESIKELCKDKFRNGTRKQVKSIDIYLNVYDGKMRAYYVINGEGGEDFYIDL